MKMKELMNKASNKFSVVAGRTGLKLQKEAPEISLGIGIVGFVGTVYLACKATLHAEEVLEKHKEMLDAIDAAKDLSVVDEDMIDPELRSCDYTPEDERRDILVANAKTVGAFVKLYAPSVALGAFSLGCIIYSRNLTHRRYLAAVSAYNAVSEAFKIYRKRVVEEQGVMMDRHYRYGTDIIQVSTEEVDENGKKKKGKETVENIDTSMIQLVSDEARYFDASNPNWDQNAEFNLTFLRTVERMATDKLHTKGHIFLNDVYAMLGIKDSQNGAIVGWVLGAGDDYVDFGLYNGTNGARRFVNGDENTILLDFNHDGIIWNKI